MPGGGGGFLRLGQGNPARNAQWKQHQSRHPNQNQAKELGLARKKILHTFKF